MTKKTDPTIRFVAAVYKVQTLTDNGIRLTLDLPETAIPQMAMLAECQRFGRALSVEAKLTEVDDAIEKGAKRRSLRMDRGRDENGRDQ
jgi:hypothetical protein